MTEVGDVFVELPVTIVVEHVADFVVGRTSARTNTCRERALPTARDARDGDAGGALGSGCNRAGTTNLRRRRSRNHLVNLTVAVVVDAVTRLGGTQERASVFARIVAIEVVITILATLEGAHAHVARPNGVNGVVVAVVAARAAVCHVRLEVRLSGQRTVAIRIDAARIDRAGWSNGTLTGLNTRCAHERTRLARRRCAHGRRNRNVARAEHEAVVDHAVAVVIDRVACFGNRSDESGACAAAGLRAPAATAGSAVHEVRIRAGRDALLRGETFVDLTVTVVVDHVAGFGLGVDVAHAREVCPDALERAELAGHGVALAARCVHAVDVVDAAVAIVIDHVARFGLGQN